ncbi:MAG: aldose epimerase family protein [Xanthomonadales bacterium]|jgi:aldose 1-epimerase|nr:aldose epimerase family protein [Xanthomonadales bacterium]
MKTELSTLIATAAFTLLLTACSPSSEPEPVKVAAPEPPPMAEAVAPVQEVFVSKSSFGATPDGDKVMLYTLRNKAGMVARITDYGGIVVSLTAPDREGNFEDIVLGYDNLDDYIAASPYFGALIGRYGNRIRAGKFELDGFEYNLATNDGPNHLHGGDKGFDKVVWDSKMEETQNGPSLLLSYVSVDGEEGYPGTLHAVVRYTLTHDNELVVEYEAVTDKATPVNLTHHSYFNLSGNARRDILGHTLQLNADHFTPVDDTLIPTGEYRPVAGTPFDFRSAKPIGQDIGMDNEQLAFGGGYDHNWVVDQNADGEWRHILTLADPESGRVMTIHSDEPGLQFYSGNFLDGSNIGKGGVVYGYRYGMCLETQHFPDGPNQPNFPSTILQPGEVYKTRTVHTFSTD